MLDASRLAFMWEVRMAVDRIRRALRSHPSVYSLARSVWRVFRAVRRWVSSIRAGIRAWNASQRTRREVARQTAAWTQAGRPAPPPPAVKQRIVADYARLSGCDCLVETGTYYGEMVLAQHRRFRRIFTIELDDRLFERAVRRFRNDPHILVLHGDSGRVLPTLLESIRWPCLFWLDGHFSGGSTARGELETPVIQEVEAILRHPTPGHVVLIDDARCFGEGDYPTLEMLRQRIDAVRPDWILKVADDIIRIHSRRAEQPSVTGR